MKHCRVVVQSKGFVVGELRRGVQRLFIKVFYAFINCDGMIDYIVEILRDYPAVALFLTVGVGFLLGRLRYKSFTLGSVTAVLLVGVFVGQLHIPMSGPLKTVFFMMFLFSVGYSVGPQFFRALRGSGLKQALFAVLMSGCCFGVTLAISLLLSYSPGVATGLFSGSQTCSAVLGLGSEAISKLPLDAGVKSQELNMIPLCYAVTYIFGTFGTVVILGSFGPRLLGGLDKVKHATKMLEKQMNDTSWENDPANITALRPVTYRAYRVENDFFKIGKPVHEVEEYLAGAGVPVFVDRVRSRGKIFNAMRHRVINLGDVIVLCGRREYMVNDGGLVGPEVSDAKLLNYPVKRVPVLVTKDEVIGMKLSKLLEMRYMHAVNIRNIKRDGREVNPVDDPTVEKGDILTLVGSHTALTNASSHIGHMDMPTVASDLMFVGLAIFVGGVFGAMTLMIGSIPVSFGTSGGALIAGLVFGWLRSKRPTYGHIPDSAIWLMNNLGLNVFVATIGIESGPTFVEGIRAVGPMIFVAGIIATTLPVLFGVWMGHKVFKFNPAITLGCCAGSRTSTASLGAVQNTLGSTVPAIGYTVTYAVSNLLLVVWGVALVTILT